MLYCPVLPARIARLEELANNLWWSWHDHARQLFRELDYPLWKASGHNPVKLLCRISPEILQSAASDSDFLRLFDSVIASFDAAMMARNTWFDEHHSGLLDGPVAYFSMEYALHNSLPIYAGGLGALAGDICKEASDLGIPMVAVGFMYPQGYFHQHIAADGRQEEIYQQIDFFEAPIDTVLSREGTKSVAKLEMCDTTLSIAVWLVRAGLTKIYLLDTNLEQNSPHCRQLSARLYIADQEVRLEQEIVLGIGGVRVLRALGINPAVWHGNEGHTAFMMLERIREEVERGVSFDEAMDRVKSTTVFTTHTPVMAGHDIFEASLMEKYFGAYWKSLGIDRETFFRLAQPDKGTATSRFNMTALALRLANYRYGVSQLHEKVTRKMWSGLWPDLPEEKVPISHVTNGIHVPTWLAPETCHLYDKYAGKDWIDRHDDPDIWQKLVDMPDEELWSAHRRLKMKLLSTVHDSIRTRWIEDDIPLKHVLAMGVLLDPDTLTIAFTRRFTEYKRPSLLLHDIERLKRIITKQFAPVQIIYAGKSHPADLRSKSLLQQVYNDATDRDFQGRIIFVEDYNLHVAHYLVQGVDVWLNNPRRWQEASGTSGMKAALNGVLNLSVRDGWWHEGYNGSNGWAIGPDVNDYRPEDEDEADAESLYNLLEKEVVPLYYNRDRNGVPHGWVRMMKESIRSTVPFFSAMRMLKEYTGQAYQPAARAISATPGSK